LHGDFPLSFLRPLGLHARAYPQSNGAARIDTNLVLFFLGALISRKSPISEHLHKQTRAEERVATALWLGRFEKEPRHVDLMERRLT
jgi:hypothetical protein